MSSGDDRLMDLDDDDEDFGLTTVGTDLFDTQQVPDYPAIARLGQFEILGRIARGGMAEVYLARERQGDGTVRHVVVKRVLTEMQHDAKMLRMFLEEGRIALRLFHPNVCHVYECGEAAGTTFMALEWVHGVPLRDVIRRAQPRGLPIPVAVHIIARIAAALAYVHDARGIDGRPLSIIHQDVSPHNVMLSWKGQVKLLDFGIAKTSAQAQAGTDAPQGKYEYMSPEQIRGAPMDARSDVFALGACLYEILCGRALFAREGLPQVMSAVVHEPTPSLREVRPELPEALDRIAQKALAKSPADRYQSAGEMQRALEGWLAKEGHTVADIRVSLAISGLFDAEEKAPLRPGADMLTGSLPALGALDFDAGRASGGLQPAWTERFDHSPLAERAPSSRPLSGRVIPRRAKPSRDQLQAIAIVGGAVLLALVILLATVTWIAFR